MRKFKHTEKMYAKVHAQCISKLNLDELDPQEIQILTSLYTQQDVFKDSPFVEARAQR